MKQAFYICEHCGNIIAMVRDCGVPVYCCGEKMQQIQPGNSEGSAEKHIPFYQVDGKKVTVQVGSTMHPMNQEHYIQWICLETNHGIQYRELSPGDTPATCFALCDEDEVMGVYAFCNQHSLWKR